LGLRTDQRRLVSRHPHERTLRLVDAVAADVKEDGFMSGPSTPQVDTSGEDPAKWDFSDLKDGKETMHKASSGEYGNSVHFEFGSGSKWDGCPMYCSWYA
jgi:hypothetical protein